MTQKRDFSTVLKDLGIEVYNAAKKEYDVAVSGAKKQFKKEKLRRRFNLENPFKFVFLDSKMRISFLDSLLARHGKRYDEDDILVFFGKKEENNIEPKQRIKDLSNNSVYEIIELVEVTIPVTMGETVIEVPCTAVYGKVL
ncbi:MAG: hypothetical protein KAU02_03905 [Tenericutes bacterium]|nr:hypothetical protein [Mycoplasmatota bacterium]